MDTSAIDALGWQPVRELWYLLSASGDVPTFVSKNLALLMKNGFSGLYNFGTDIDAYNPSSMVYVVNQGGLGLPDRSYYQDPAIFKSYTEHIAKMLKLTGQGTAASDATKIAQFEAQLANITVPSDQLFDPFTSTNRMDWSELIRLAPNLGFDKLITELNLRSNVAVTIDSIKYFTQLSELLGKTRTYNLVMYFHWRLLHQSATRISAEFEKENFDFYGRILSGTPTAPARSKTCMTSTVTVVPELAGKLYAQKAFPAASKTAAEKMYDAILSAFEINVQKLDWMDPVTLERAIVKLKQILRLIGYPENPRSYSEYNFNAGYFANWLLAAKAEFIKTLAAAGGPSDRTHWEMRTCSRSLDRKYRFDCFAFCSLLTSLVSLLFLNYDYS